MQAGQTGVLAKSPTAGLIAMAGTAVCILVVGALSERPAWPAYEQAAQMPRWAWFGGGMGGAVILAQFILTRQIGAAPFPGLLVRRG